MTKDEALKLALEALTYIYTETTADEDELIDQAITAIKAALAQPYPEYDRGFSNGWDKCAERQATAQPVQPEQWTPEDMAYRPGGLAQAEQNQFKPDYDTEAVLVEEMQRMAKQIAEMQDWEAVAADQAMAIAMMKVEQEPIGYLWPTAMHPDFRYTRQKRDGVDGTPVYTSPPQRQPLTKKEIDDLFYGLADTAGVMHVLIARAIEAAHGIGDKT